MGIDEWNNSNANIDETGTGETGTGESETGKLGIGESGAHLTRSFLLEEDGDGKKLNELKRLKRKGAISGTG